MIDGQARDLGRFSGPGRRQGDFVEGAECARVADRPAPGFDSRRR